MRLQDMLIQGIFYSCLGSGDSDLEEDSIDTLDECFNVKNHISNWGYYANIYINPTLDKFDDVELNSPILFFAGHGNSQLVNTGGTSGITCTSRPGYKDINNVDFSTTEFAFLATCKSAYNGDTNSPIARALLRCGVDVTLGWTTNVTTTHMGSFSGYFFEALDCGKSYFDSVEFAKKENINPNFNINDYEISEEFSDRSSLNSISFNYIVGEMISDFGYSLFIISDNVKLITEHGTDITVMVPPWSLRTLLSDETVCLTALENNNISDPVGEQIVYKHLDSATGKIKYNVHTVYGTHETTYYATDFEYLK